MNTRFTPNDQQLAYIESSVTGAKRVLAGPGSGKTATLVHRVSRLIDVEGVDPDRIIAVSFSKIAATELGERAHQVNPKINVARFCTIHALAFRALRSHDTVRDVAAGKKTFLIKKHAQDALEKFAMSEIGWKDFMAYVYSAKSRAIRSNVLDSHYYKGLAKSGWNFQSQYPAWSSTAHTMLASAHREFDRLMRANNVMTFADMLVELEWLLEDDEAVLAQQQATTDILFIDEAQDTNPQSMRILMRLAAPQDNVSLIGDTDQAVFGFLGANAEENLWTAFEGRFPVHETFMLETNYRSTSKIISFTNTVIAPNYDEQTEHYRKTLIPRDGAPEGKDVTYAVYLDSWEEAQAVTDSIVDDIFDNDYNPGDFYVVARTRAQLLYTLMYLFRAKIPAMEKSGISFWDLAHVQDLLAYMQLSADRGNKEAFQRVYRKASRDMKQPYDKRKDGQVVIARGAPINHRYLGKEFLEVCGGSYYGLEDAMSRDGWQEGIRDLQQLMQKIDTLEQPGDKARIIIEQCLQSWWALEEGSSDDSEGNDRIQDLLTIADIASQKIEGEYAYTTTKEFLAYVDELIQKVREAALGDTSKVVLLGTIHGVKGTERPIVHVIGVMQGLLPHWTVNGASFGTGILPLGRSNSLEEERRLFFVAVSRAKDKVHLHGPLAYHGKPHNKSVFAYECGLVDDRLSVEAAGIVAREFGDVDGSNN